MVEYRAVAALAVALGASCASARPEPTQPRTELPHVRPLASTEPTRQDGPAAAPEEGGPGVATLDGRLVWSGPLSNADPWMREMWAVAQRLLAIGPLPALEIDGPASPERLRRLVHERVQPLLDATAPLRRIPPPPPQLDADQRFFTVIVEARVWDHLAMRVDDLRPAAGLDEPTAEAARAEVRQTLGPIARRARELYFVCKMITAPSGLESWTPACEARMHELEPFCLLGQPPASRSTP